MWRTYRYQEDFRLARQRLADHRPRLGQDRLQVHQAARGEEDPDGGADAPADPRTTATTTASTTATTSTATSSRRCTSRRPPLRRAHRPCSTCSSTPTPATPRRWCWIAQRIWRPVAGRQGRQPLLSHSTHARCRPEVVAVVGRRGQRRPQRHQEQQAASGSSRSSSTTTSSATRCRRSPFERDGQRQPGQRLPDQAEEDALRDGPAVRHAARLRDPRLLLHDG